MIDLQKIQILAKANRLKSFELKLILILKGMQTSNIGVFGTQKTRTHTLKSQRTQYELLFSADFGPEA